MKRILAALFAIMLTVMPSALYAVQPDEIMADPAQEARARNLSRELRCMVCQNQSIDDSDAPLARDLRLLVRERIAAGSTDQQVMDFLVARYGKFVLLKPPVGRDTLILWLEAALRCGSTIAAAIVRPLMRRVRHSNSPPRKRRGWKS